MSPSERAGEHRIRPEELAAVVAAVEAVWPRPVIEDAAPARSPWRFSGRWWQPDASVASSRRRPS